MDSTSVESDPHLLTKVQIDIPSEPQCYCSRPRDFSIADFQCSVCYKWFHLDCIAFNIGNSLPFLTAYHFMCKKCNPNNEEVFSRKQANFAVMCQTALANLMWRNDGRLYFSKERELIPFLEEFWEELTTQPRKSNTSWYPNIHKTLTSNDCFKTIERDTDLLVCLANTDLGKMGPSYDRFRALTSQLRTSITKLGVSSGSASQLPPDSGDNSMNADSDHSTEMSSWRKRKSPGSGLNLAANSNHSSYGDGTHPGGQNGDPGLIDLNSDYPLRVSYAKSDAPSNATNFGGNLVRSTRRGVVATGSFGTAAVGGLGIDEGRTKLNPLGVPVDHPFNKEGYRYILVELDKHASGRKLWDDCEHTAGKPIPGLFYRVYLSPKVVLSAIDRGFNLKLNESQLILTGDKGYSMARATHGVHQGAWYFEATIVEHPEGTATRIGWAQPPGNLHAPCGYDKFGYSWRSIFGTVFHESRGRHFTDSGYGKNDVIGCLIILPPCESTSSGDVAGSLEASEQKPSNTRVFLPPSYKDKPLVRFRTSYYFEEKDEPSKAEKFLTPLPGSKIIYYRNGECMGPAFENIYAGLYYPAISIYRSATVAANFGPNFRYPPTLSIKWRPMCERLTGTIVEQTVADMLHLVENTGSIEQVVKSYSSAQ